MELKILKFCDDDSKLIEKIESISSKKNYKIIDFSNINFLELKTSRLVFIITLNDIGMNYEVYKFLERAREQDDKFFIGSIAGMVIKSNNEYYTKKMASNIIFILNSMGCRIIGHPLVEAIEEYKNFNSWKNVIDKSHEEIFSKMLENLMERILNYKKIHIKNPKVLVLHAGIYGKSNTLAFWEMIKKNLNVENLREFHVDDGTAIDCYGCSYNTCMYYSEKRSCFYGGIITEELLPIIEESDIIIWICPNYNDSISAKLMAVVNRLTVLYKRISFYDKKIFSVIVSGNSGSDSVASQIIGALNVNKGFHLPPFFFVTEIAGDIGSIHKVKDINEKALAFSEIINSEI